MPYIEVGSELRFHQVELPPSKGEIELWILEHALAAIAAHPPSPALELTGPPVQNPEDDFDFTLPTEAGPHHLDLMEMVILPKGATSYEDGTTKYYAEQMAYAIYQKIRSKAKHYGKPKAPLHLLLYSTDWRFRVLPQVANFLKLALSLRKHPFATVAYFTPHDATDGEFAHLFPISKDDLSLLAQQDHERRLRNQHTLLILADPRRARLEPTEDPASRAILFRPI